MSSLSDLKNLVHLNTEPKNSLKMDKAMPTLLDQTASKIVGQPINRLHGNLKVCGQATFAAEYQLEGQLYGVLVPSTIGKGKVIDIHIDDAMKSPDVVDIIIDFDTFIRNPQ